MWRACGVLCASERSRRRLFAAGRASQLHSPPHAVTHALQEADRSVAAVPQDRDYMKSHLVQSWPPEAGELGGRRYFGATP